MDITIPIEGGFAVTCYEYAAAEAVHHATIVVSKDLTPRAHVYTQSGVIVGHIEAGQGDEEGLRALLKRMELIVRS